MKCLIIPCNLLRNGGGHPQEEVFDVKVDAKDGTVFQSKPDNHD